jgi:AcrR family transcriptional regulator
MADRRQTILEAALAVLRDDGYLGFTQPRVAARAGVRQSHLTYYFPTRADLLVAVAQVAVDNQRSIIGSLVESGEAGPAGLASVLTQAENARVLLTLVCAADDVPEVRELFQGLAAGMVANGESLLGTLGAPPRAAGADLLYAVSVGVVAISFATGRDDRQAWATSVLQTAIELLTQPEPAS